MSAIDDKYTDLKARGLDLGAPLGAEEPAEAGGRVRRYEDGNIYWCSATGAHVVRGGILSLYLADGGPGANPNTGARELGYPTSDEEREPGAGTPYNTFEWGAIYWTQGTGGCVLHGAHAAVRNWGLGLPITGTLPIAGGRATYFQGGIVFSTAPTNVPGVETPLVGVIEPPGMGRPLLLDTESARFPFIRWLENDRSYYDALRAWRPTLFEELLEDRFLLVPVSRPTFLVSLNPAEVGESQSTAFRVMIRGSLEVAPDTPIPLEDRTLYDLCLQLPNGNTYPLSQHCIYTKSSWDRFGLLHITDLHISGRNEAFREQLLALGLDEAAVWYANFQDNLRDFIRYANRLHKFGLADVVVATGDLVDYVEEDPEPVGEDNFVRLRRLLLGEPLEPGTEPGVELELPIFATLGNHDYRLHPYALRADIDLFGEEKDKAVNEHSAHNLIESEALALQGGKTPSFGISNAEEGARSLRIDEFENAYGNSFAPRGSYIVELGEHRLVVLNTKYDNGIPPELGLFNLLQLFAGKSIGVLEDVDYHPATQKLLNGGGPDSAGLAPNELDLLRKAIADTGNDAVVIAAIHCPPFHTKGREYPYYHRETVHPTVDPALMEAYVHAAGIAGTGWPRTGTAQFAECALIDGLDDGFLPHGGQEFLDACAGRNLPRSIDLVLYGHHHARVEHRLRFNDGSGTIEYFTDFYSENPERYYDTTNLIPQRELPVGAKIAVHVVDGAPANAVVQPVREHPDPNSPPTLSGRIDVPPYPDTLNDAADSKAWWERHRPVFAQTAALGPIDERQRFGTMWKVDPPAQNWRPQFEGDPPPGYFPQGTSLERRPAPHRNVSFCGFRFIQVEDGAISKMRYVTLRELRDKDFKLPWEPEGQPIVHEEVIIDGTVSPGRQP